jgi:hypothetical protein
MQKAMAKAIKTPRVITLDDLRGHSGLSRTARAALLARQPRTVRRALCIHGVGRKTTKRLLALGLLTDPEGVQTGARTAEELRGNDEKAGTSAARSPRGRD